MTTSIIDKKIKTENKEHWKLLWHENSFLATPVYYAPPTQSYPGPFYYAYNPLILGTPHPPCWCWHGGTVVLMGRSLNPFCCILLSPSSVIDGGSSGKGVLHPVPSFLPSSSPVYNQILLFFYRTTG